MKQGKNSELALRIGKNISGKRKSLGWTQDQLAERTGCDAETISRFERGVHLPSILTLEKISYAMRCSQSELLGDTREISADTNAQKISVWLEGLNQCDQDFVIGQIAALCRHLTKKP